MIRSWLFVRSPYNGIVLQVLTDSGAEAIPVDAEAALYAIETLSRFVRQDRERCERGGSTGAGKGVPPRGEW